MKTLRLLRHVFMILVFMLVFHPIGGVFFPDKSSDKIKEKICLGTEARLSVPSNRNHHYRTLRERYADCTYIDGNLELTWLENENYDLSFLQNVREVTGYVLMFRIHVKMVVLPNLQIIRGRTLFQLSRDKHKFSLFISLCNATSIQMPALGEILTGVVGIFENHNLCHISTIMWEELVAGSGTRDVLVTDGSNSPPGCKPCHKSCPGGCWGEGPENCQKFSKLNCSLQCSGGRCFGALPRECCHLFCAAGCTGPKRTDCLACRNFSDDGECTEECPSMLTYNPTTYSWERNPKGKYAYGALCVSSCPDHLLRDNGACVKSCPPSKTGVKGECVSCEGACPKTCRVVDADGLVHSGNIDGFKNCTVVEGSISILDHSFKGFQDVHKNFTLGPKYPPMHPDQLEVFSQLKKVTGFINIQAHHTDFRNLSFFRNLEIIAGRSLTEYYSLYILRTSLTFLGLRSLKKISSGSIGILENKELCYVNELNWRIIAKSQEQAAVIFRNRDRFECVAKGFDCDEECHFDGCWGPGPEQCLSCKNFKYENECVKDCHSIKGIYEAGARVCKPCHEECSSGCAGPGNGNCTECKHVRDDLFCYASCPEMKYDDDGVCKPCHPNCVGGCTGPANAVREGGCVSCEKVIVDSGSGTAEFSCLSKNESCPTRYYYEWVGPESEGAFKALAGKAACKKCHPSCKRCTGYGIHEQVCQKCANYKRGKHCEDECPQDHYADERRRECVPCSNECWGCHGPEASDCYRCRNFRIYLDETQPKNNESAFYCTAVCPPDLPYKIYPEDDAEPYCSASVDGDSVKFFEYTELLIALAVLLVLSIFLYLWRRKVKAKEEQVRITKLLTGVETSVPLNPSNVEPNLATLVIVKEEALRMGGILGEGAFGTVYKGFWVPKGENVKIPVAIKVLKKGSGDNSNKEFLDEAYIMASVEHPNLLRLLAVCMTSQMMLVTQLMPLGCLLDYVRKNRDKIGSKPLLNWCTQIARGMAYLEEKRLLHRDLAARNVLLQTPNLVKITDFGLAKLLDVNEQVYKAGDGKVPVRWVAVECLQHGIYTHKSDVWAFGVTVWELLTYGDPPYGNIPAKDVPALVLQGERLPQPQICTIEVYMVMIKCWMLDAYERPSFKDLAEEFAKMARDPGRYLVIQGDKLLRLPAYTTLQRKRDLMHTVSGVISDPDGPETIMAADEYMPPLVPSPMAREQNQGQADACRDPLDISKDKTEFRKADFPRGHPPPAVDNPEYMTEGGVGIPMVETANNFQGGVPANAPLLFSDKDNHLMSSPQPMETTVISIGMTDGEKSKDKTEFENVENAENAVDGSQTGGDLEIPPVGAAGILVGFDDADVVSNAPGASPNTTKLQQKDFAGGGTPADEYLMPPPPRPLIPLANENWTQKEQKDLKDTLSAGDLYLTPPTSRRGIPESNRNQENRDSELFGRNLNRTPSPGTSPVLEIIKEIDEYLMPPQPRPLIPAADQDQRNWKNLKFTPSPGTSPVLESIKEVNEYLTPPRPRPVLRPFAPRPPLTQNQPESETEVRAAHPLGPRKDEDEQARSTKTTATLVMTDGKKSKDETELENVENTKEMKSGDETMAKGRQEF